MVHYNNFIQFSCTLDGTGADGPKGPEGGKSRQIMGKCDAHTVQIKP